jgi:glycosyltransferase involved in cell wall biosynthesis
VRLITYPTRPFFVLRRRPRFHLSICAILLNEAPFVLEWIAFHRLVGIEHFYIYDNGSTDGTVELLRERFPPNVVTIVDWPQRPAQLSSYRHAIEQFAGETEWGAFIDCDEFLFPTYEDSLPPLLDMARHRSGLCAFWLLFGSNGLQTRPPGLCIEAFTRRAREDFNNNRHPKSIVRLHEVVYFSDSHFFDTRRGSIDEKGRVVTLNRKTPALPTVFSHERIRINHYFTKSAAEWKIKQARGMVEKKPGAPDFIRPQSHFDIHDRNEVEDLTIQRFLPRLKASLAALA